MTGAQITARIDAIDVLMDELANERIELEDQDKVARRWSPEAIKQRIRELVIKQFGVNHDIKLALFKPNCEYNDQGYDYRDPILILIKSDYEEAHVEPNLEGILFPSEKDQKAYYDAVGEDLYIDNIKVKF